MSFILFTLTFLVLNKILVNSNNCSVEMDYVIKDCVNATVTSIGTTLVYSIKPSDRLKEWLICPRVSDTTNEWHLTFYTDNETNNPITDGSFYSNINYTIEQMCLDVNGTLRIYQDGFLNDSDSNSGFVRLSFVSSQLTTDVCVRYGPTGVEPLDGNVIVTVDDGTSLFQLQFIVFYPSVGNITVFYNDQVHNTNIPIDQRCLPTTSTESTKIQLVQFKLVSPSDAGVYAVRVSGSEGTFESNITLQVGNVSDPTSMVMMSSSLSTSPTLTSCITHSTISSNTPTPTTTTTTSGSDNVIVWVFVGVGMFFIIVIILILSFVVILCCYSCKKKSVPSSMTVLYLTETGETINDAKKTKLRLNSTSSDRPLTMGGSMSSVNSSSTTERLSDYTAVYYSPEYVQCASILKDKHNDLIHIIVSWEEVRLAIIQPNCTDILVFANPGDEVFKEIMCCGIDPPRPNKREKLRIIMFTDDDNFPANTIGINGYKVVQVEGPPSPDSLVTAINKAEFPELIKPSSRQQQHRGQNETDSPALEEQKRTNELLSELLDAQKKTHSTQEQSVEIQKEAIEVGRETNQILEETMITEKSETMI